MKIRNKNKQNFIIIDRIPKSLLELEESLSEEEFYNKIADNSNYFEEFSDEDVEEVKQRLFSRIVMDKLSEDSIKDKLSIMYLKNYGH